MDAAVAETVEAPEFAASNSNGVEARHSIRGRARAWDGTPVANARIEVNRYDTDPPSSSVALTDAEGRFEFSGLGSGEYRLTAAAAGFRVERMNRVPVDGPLLALELVQGACARGRVIDAYTGLPLPDFTCALRPVNPGSQTFGRAVQQVEWRDAVDGAFEICGLDAGSYVVEVSAPNYAAARSEDFALHPGTFGHVLIEMSLGGTLRGRVVDAKSGVPIVGAEVRTFDNSYMKNPFTDLFGDMMPRNTTKASARTDLDGQFEFALLTPEVYQLEIVDREHVALVLKDLSVDDGRELELGTLAMSHGAVIRGIVFGRDGSPLANADVSVRPKQGYRMLNARTGRDGRYVVESVPIGTHTVSATHGGPEDGDPFRKILDMKQSEITSTVSEGGDYYVDLNLGSN